MIGKSAIGKWAIGKAPVVAGAATYSYSGSGSLAFSGTATSIWNSLWSYTGSGELLFSGNATTISSGETLLTQEDLNNIAAAVWADATAVSAHAKLDAIIARLTC